MNTQENNMDLIVEEFGDFTEMELCVKENQSTSCRAEIILNELDEVNYLEFMKVFCRRFTQLDNTNKQILKEIMCIQEININQNQNQNQNKHYE